MKSNLLLVSHCAPRITQCSQAKIKPKFSGLFLVRLALLSCCLKLLHNFCTLFGSLTARRRASPWSCLHSRSAASPYGRSCAASGSRSEGPRAMYRPNQMNLDESSEHIQSHDIRNTTIIVGFCVLASRLRNGMNWQAGEWATVQLLPTVHLTFAKFLVTLSGQHSEKAR